MERELMDRLLEYVRTAGAIAARKQSEATVGLKADSTYVTSVDLQLSELALEMFSPLVSPTYIVTEEHRGSLAVLTSNDLLCDREYVVVVDPIDGTRNFFHNMPLYGISVGVLRNLSPCLGAVVFPALDELYYADNTSGYIITGTYAERPEKRRLNAQKTELNSNSILLGANSFAKRFGWNYDVCTFMLSGCVTINSCWPVVGRGIGSIYCDHIWDVAGSWPIFARVGFEMRGIHSEKLIDHYDTDDYDPRTHRIKEPALVCRPEHFARLKRGVIARI